MWEDMRNRSLCTYRRDEFGGRGVHSERSSLPVGKLVVVIVIVRAIFIIVGGIRLVVLAALILTVSFRPGSVVTDVISIVRDVVQGIEIVAICIVLILYRNFGLSITLFRQGFYLGLLVGLRLGAQIRGFFLSIRLRCDVCPDRKCCKEFEDFPFCRAHGSCSGVSSVHHD